MPAARQPITPKSSPQTCSRFTTALSQQHRSARTPAARTCRVPVVLAVRQHRTSRRTRAAGKTIRPGPSAGFCNGARRRTEGSGSIAAPQPTTTRKTDKKQSNWKNEMSNQWFDLTLVRRFMLEPPLRHHPVRHPARERCERGTWRQSEPGARPCRRRGTDHRFSAGLPEHRAAPRAAHHRQVPGGDQGGVIRRS